MALSSKILNMEQVLGVQAMAQAHMLASLTHSHNKIN